MQTLNKVHRQQYVKCSWGSFQATLWHWKLQYATCRRSDAGSSLSRQMANVNVDDKTPGHSGSGYALWEWHTSHPGSKKCIGYGSYRYPLTAQPQALCTCLHFPHWSLSATGRLGRASTPCGHQGTVSTGTLKSSTFTCSPECPSKRNVCLESV